MANATHFDVIIIGGSYAGLSAAMSLGRSLRNVLIVDNGMPCNRQTPYSHNFLTHDGEKPDVIAEKAKAGVMKYPTVKFHSGLAVSATKAATGFAITTKAHNEFTAKKLIFATGIKDIQPTIKGFKECWGISVIHCPYCHGYEFRNEETALFANGESAFHLASLLNNLTSRLTVLTSGKADFTDDQLAKLNKNNIQLIETEIVEIEHNSGHVKNVVFIDGNKLECRAVYTTLPFEQHSNIPVSLGCELTEEGLLYVDDDQKTTIDGVFACGDNTSKMRAIANAVYSGNLTGAFVNKELTDEQF